MQWNYPGRHVGRLAIIGDIRFRYGNEVTFLKPARLFPHDFRRKIPATLLTPSGNRFWNARDCRTAPCGNIGPRLSAATFGQYSRISALRVTGRTMQRGRRNCVLIAKRGSIRRPRQVQFQSSRAIRKRANLSVALRALIRPSTCHLPTRASNSRMTNESSWLRG